MIIKECFKITLEQNNMDRKPVYILALFCS